LERNVATIYTTVLVVFKIYKNNWPPSDWKLQVE